MDLLLTRFHHYCGTLCLVLYSLLLGPGLPFHHLDNFFLLITFLNNLLCLLLLRRYWFLWYFFLILADYLGLAFTLALSGTSTCCNCSSLPLGLTLLDCPQLLLIPPSRSFLLLPSSLLGLLNLGREDHLLHFFLLVCSFSAHDFDPR